MLSSSITKARKDEKTKEGTEGDIANRPGLVFDKLSSDFIAVAIHVHKQLGPGFMESVYHEALKVALQLRGIPFESQKRIEVSFEGRVVGVHILDLLVGGELIVEIKAVKQLEEVHFAQLRSYLRATSRRVGLLLNFNSTTLTIKRVVN